MQHAPDIRIAPRTYSLNPECNRYQVPLGELDALRMSDIPPHHHPEVMGVPMPAGLTPILVLRSGLRLDARLGGTTAGPTDSLRLVFTRVGAIRGRREAMPPAGRTGVSLPGTSVGGDRRCLPFSRGDGG
jgi:hypothetical protein